MTQSSTETSRFHDLHGYLIKSAQGSPAVIIAHAFLQTLSKSGTHLSFCPTKTLKYQICTCMADRTILESFIGKGKIRKKKRILLYNWWKCWKSIGGWCVSCTLLIFSIINYCIFLRFRKKDTCGVTPITHIVQLWWKFEKHFWSFNNFPKQ